MLSVALQYAARGWPVIPLELSSKEPIGKLVPNGVAHATTDPDVIKYWFARRKSANIGIACSQFLAVDSDVRNNGDVELAKLLAQHGPFPETPTAKTGSGGQHILFKRPTEALRGKLCQGVDLVHGARRYIVAAPSIHPSGAIYTWTIPPSVPLAEAPAWLIAMGRREERRASGASVSSNSALSSSQRVARGRAYAERLDPAISGSNGHTATLIVCAKLVHSVGLSADEAFEALQDWNRRCSPPWSESELRRKIDHAIRGNGAQQRRTA